MRLMLLSCDTANPRFNVHSPSSFHTLYCSTHHSRAGFCCDVTQWTLCINKLYAYGKYEETHMKKHLFSYDSHTCAGFRQQNQAKGQTAAMVTSVRNITASQREQKGSAESVCTDVLTTINKGKHPYTDALLFCLRA